MTLTSLEDNRLYLQSRDREELQLMLDVPLQQSTVSRTTLYLIAAPWQQALAPQVLEHGFARREGRVAFVHHVYQLADQLKKGRWGQIAVSNQDGNNVILDISSVDFQQPFAEFNRCRQLLPPIRLEKIKQSSVFFASGSREPGIGRDRLDLITRYLAFAPETVAGIVLDGHSDSAGSRLQNLDLSRDRARAVADYLIASGVDKSLIQAVRHHGQRYPQGDNSSAAGRSHNRRVDIRLITPGEQQDKPSADVIQNESGSQVSSA